jgi:hypothetical protein
VGAAPVSSVVPLPARGAWLTDARSADGTDRALRVSWHAEHGCAVLSTWHDGRCTGTVRLLPDEVARLVGTLADGLAEAADGALRPAELPGLPPATDGVAP